MIWIFVIILLFVIWWYLKPSKKIYNPVMIQHLTHELGQKDLDEQAINSCYIYENADVKQVAICLNAKTLKNHTALVRRGLKRSSTARDNGNVPGKGRRNQEKYKINGQWYYMLHRTHLVPYRYCLNEDEVTVWCYSHVNNGDRPDRGYLANADAREKQVWRLINQSNKTLINPWAIFNNRDIHLDLDDFERASDHYIYKHPRDEFIYVGDAEFENGQTKYVQVMLYDRSRRKKIFSVILSDVK